MLKQMHKYLFAFLLVAVAGCASIDAGEGKIIQSWFGEHTDSVIKRWGIPTRSAQLSDGTTIYEWHNSQMLSMPQTTTGTAQISGNAAYINATTSPSTFSGSCVRTLIADDRGIVVEGSSNGNNCCVMAIAGYCASLLNPKNNTEIESK